MKDNNRVLAIDLARGISVVLMVLVHTMLVYGDHFTRHESVLGKVVGVLGQGAPIFLISMGVSLVLSKRNTLRATVQRAVLVLGIGYLLNFCKFLIPMHFFGGLPVPFVEAYGLDYDDNSNVLFFFLLGDILQLAGFTLLITGVINYFTSNKLVPLVLAILIVGVSREVSGIQINIPVLGYLSDLLWSNRFNVYFPVFPWSAFILLGLFFGKWYKEKGNDIRFMFRQMCNFGLIFMVSGILLCWYDYSYHFGDFYHLGPGGTVALMGITLLVLASLNLAVRKVPSNSFFNVLFYCSKRVTSFYFIQWTLINWGMGLFGFWQNTQKEVLVLMLFFLIMSLALVRLPEKLQIRPVKDKNIPVS